MNNIIEKNKKKIFNACKEFHVEKLYTIGSVNNDDFNEESDVDLIVSFNMKNLSLEEYADNYFSMQSKLEEILDREVDLITERSIKNPYFLQEVLNTRVLLFQSN